MTSTVFTDIGSLVTNDPGLGEGLLGLRADAAFVVVDGRVAWVGDAASAPAADERVSLDGACVVPGFVDSHAHLLFAGDRSAEFAARMAGERYAAGGIRSTVAATRAASDAALLMNATRLVDEMHAAGITTFETKSGYGLTTIDESRALQLAAGLTPHTTFLGAHVAPVEYADRVEDYVALVTGEMLAACAPHARWIDAFCDRGAFDVEQARTVLHAGIAHGLQPRIHANQLQHGGGVQLAVELDCASADHCTHLDAADIDALANSNTVATLLPGAEFSTRSPYPDARRLLDAGATVALATDCNPGTSFTTNMPLCIALAVREMHMTPDEAVHAATLGGAKALRSNDIGHLAVGAQADFAVLAAPSHVHLAYRPGVPLIARTYIGGHLRKAAA